MKNYKLLIAAAIKALDNAYLLDPKGWRFGSAVLTNKGNIYSSGQYKSNTETLTMHSEVLALAHAAAHGEYEIVAIASVGTDDPNTYCHLCGLCKQLVYESSRKSGNDIDVIMANMKGKYIIKKISELTPFPWPSK